MKTEKKIFWANLGQFGPVWAKSFFFRKSENVTFLDLSTANLTLKNQKKTYGGK